MNCFEPAFHRERPGCPEDTIDASTHRGSGRICSLAAPAEGPHRISCFCSSVRPPVWRALSRPRWRCILTVVKLRELGAGRGSWGAGECASALSKSHQLDACYSLLI